MLFVSYQLSTERGCDTSSKVGTKVQAFKDVQKSHFSHLVLLLSTRICFLQLSVSFQTVCQERLLVLQIRLMNFVTYYTIRSGVVMIFSLGEGGSFNPDLLNKKGIKCRPFTEKNRPTQEVQHLISSFWAGPRRIWDQKLIFYGPLYSGSFSEGRFRGGGGMPPPPHLPTVTTPLFRKLQPHGVYECIFDVHTINAGCGLELLVINNVKQIQLNMVTVLTMILCQSQSLCNTNQYAREKICGCRVNGLEC